MTNKKRKIDVTNVNDGRTPEQVRRIGRALIALAQAQLEAEAQAEHQAGKPKPKPPVRRTPRSAA